MSTVIQNTVLDMQKTVEDGLERILRGAGKPAVLLCDRGMMDSAVYLDNDTFQDMLKQRNEEAADWRERRYNAVFHMVTAADGAAQFYTLENNEARSETPSEAVLVDHKTQRAWMGHPHLTVLDNSTDFEGKLQRLVEATAGLVGLPVNLSRTTAKFLLARPPDLNAMAVDYQIFEVEKVYLIDQDLSNDRSFSYLKSNNNDNDNNYNSNNKYYKSRSRSFDSMQDLNDVSGSSPHKSSTAQESYTFIRKRVQLDKDGLHRVGGTSYGFTSVTKQQQQNDDDDDDNDKTITVIEKKRIISAREYTTSLRQRDLKRKVVRQHRISFLYKHQSFNIHIYLEPSPGLCILHAQVETKKTNNKMKNDNDDNVDDKQEEEEVLQEEQEVELPPFLQVERRIQNTQEDVDKYGAFGISLQQR